MSKKYTLLIDESGDQGLERVMTHEQPFGASSYLTMGAVLVPTTLLPSVREQLDGVRSKLGVTQLHCTDMNHLNVAYLAKTMSRLRILAFGVISKKSTLGDYRKMIEGKKQAQDYYNKCSQYLFELVAMFCSEHGLGSADIEILF